MTTDAVRAAAVLHRALLTRGQTVGCAESLTGGELAALLSEAPGASSTFVGGVVSYATGVKRSLLGVTSQRVISADCAEQMALGVRRLLGTDWALATTGVAGPEPQEEQAVGTVYVALAGPEGARSHRLSLSGGRAAIRSAACLGALSLMVDEVASG